jgi:membrane protein
LGPIIRLILKYLVPFFFTSLLWEVAKQLFGWYILHLGRFSMVYGSLSTLVIFFLWIYYSSTILLLGGEVAFLLEKRRA